MPPAEDVRNGRKAQFQTPSSGFWETAQRFWRKSYAGDYLGLALLLAGFTAVKILGTPFYQQFVVGDLRISHPHAPVQRVSTFYLFLYSSIIPLTLILLATLAIPLPRILDLHKAHVSTLGLATSIITTLFLTDILKDAIGRPRPDLIARCKPDLDTPLNKLVSIDVCTNDNLVVVRDGWRSFPSGHSSFAFSGLGFLAMFLAAQTHVLRPRASMAVVILCLAPLLAAAMIAISRLEDYRHGPLDVLGGSILGFSVAYFNFRRYYPSLLDRGCDEPYSAPDGSVSGSRRGSPGGEFVRMRDEEEMYADAERFDLGDDNGDDRGGRGALR